MTLRTLLIDDEPPACDVLRTLLSEIPGVLVVGEAGTFDEARERLAIGDYDVVLLDVQLCGGSGFDLLPHVRPEAKVIFVTACDVHALRAFEVNALDFLLKPIALERLTLGLRRMAVPISDEAAAPARALTIKDRVLIKLSAGNERFVSLAEIRLIASCENYSALTLAEGARFLTRKTMRSWEELLPPKHFVRVHRTAIINLDHVVGLGRDADSVSLLQLDGVSEPIAVSRRYLPALRAGLAGLKANK